MTIVVLDASGAAEIAARTAIGVDFYNRLLNANKVLAPDLYIAEVSNVMWKKGRRDNANIDVYIDIAQDCISYVHEYERSVNLWEEALRASIEQDHPVYDMLYAVLAKRHGALLLTTDGKLAHICEKLSVRTRGVE